MFNTRQVLNAETQSAELYIYNHDTKQHDAPIPFKYKTYDDTQYRESRNQMQTGHLTSKFSVSIKTSSLLEFKVKDKVRLHYDNRMYEITSVQELQNHNVLQSIISPSAKGQHTKLLHLNKDSA